MTFAKGLLVAALVAASVTTFAGQAHAQGYGGPPGYYTGPPPPAHRGVIRSDIIFGFSLGLGGIFPADCHECDGYGSFGLQGHIGGMIAPQVALFFDASGLYHVFEDSSVLSSSTFLGVIRGWLGHIFWLQAGLGGGYLTATDESGYFVVEARWGGAAMVGAGIEVMQTPTFAMDIQLRISGSRFSYAGDAFGMSNVGLFLGFNWY